MTDEEAKWLARALDLLDEMMNPPHQHQRTQGEQKGEGKSGEGEGEASKALKEAADAKAKKMAENRKAGLRPGQLPPPGEGDGTKGAQFNGEPKPMNLPDPGNVTADDLKDWSKLKGKKREQVLGRMRDQWPEGYRRAIEAYITAIANRQNRGAPIQK